MRAMWCGHQVWTWVSLRHGFLDATFATYVATSQSLRTQRSTMGLGILNVRCGVGTRCNALSTRLLASVFNQQEVGPSVRV